MRYQEHFVQCKTQGRHTSISRIQNPWDSFIRQSYPRVLFWTNQAMEGAFRATYRVKPNRIAGQANLVAADNSAANNLVAASAVNSLIGVAAMVVGQYYMTQINGQLDRINDYDAKQKAIFPATCFANLHY